MHNGDGVTRTFVHTQSGHAQGALLPPTIVVWLETFRGQEPVGGRQVRLPCSHFPMQSQCHATGAHEEGASARAGPLPVPNHNSPIASPNPRDDLDTFLFLPPAEEVAGTCPSSGSSSTSSRKHIRVGALGLQLSISTKVNISPPPGRVHSKPFSCAIRSPLTKLWLRNKRIRGCPLETPGVCGWHKTRQDKAPGPRCASGRVSPKNAVSRGPPGHPSNQTSVKDQSQAPDRLLTPKPQACSRVPIDMRSALAW